MVRPVVNDPAVAERLAAAAFELVSEAGAGAVTVREVADRAGCSVTAIYSLYGGKDALLGMAVRRAADQLQEGLAATEFSDQNPVAELAGMGKAYLDWAAAHPHAYKVLFGGTLSSTPSAETPPDRDPAAPLMRSIHRAIVAGALAGPPEVIATTFWAALHGLATLINEHAINPEAGRAAGLPTIQAVLRGWAPTWSPGNPPQS